jgi:hypothetical protein
MVRGVPAKAMGTNANSGVPTIVAGATHSETNLQATEVPSLVTPPAMLD